MYCLSFWKNLAIKAQLNEFVLDMIRFQALMELFCAIFVSQQVAHASKYVRIKSFMRSTR